MADIFNIPVRTSEGKKMTLGEFEGKVLLVVNTASQCGFTPQYQGLEDLYRRYKDRGLMVLGFPCNQFGHQEPGSDSEIQEFCTLNFGVSFPIYAKVDVNGSDAHPLFSHLKQEAPGIFGTERIKWNFTKFLVGRDGAVVKRYAPKDKPEALAADIEALL
ncbi:glutathione peroxidase [Microbulbifer elongatus]|uniref:Glutathione peroxidase n=1 Tax=Microbulbifer elongatus TaxID=86173 RepID=A0ABT1P0X7_9GAMM|nr:glutathione peroxidase [Microbulbifer elongatus]MCQ3829781.1 glutathione peroxidase [Microbulbifer elongatus]